MKFAALTLCILVCTVSIANGASSKEEQIRETLRIMNILYQEAVMYKDKEYTAEEFRDFRGQVQKTVETTLATIQNPEILVRLTLTADLFYLPGNAKDVKFDEVFFQTYHICIAKLAENVCQENYEALKTIQSEMNPDGGDSVVLKEILARFEQQLGKLE
jgi:hypothetical protein